MESSQKHLLKDEHVLDLTAAASQTVSKLFHNALSGNDRFFYVVKTITCNSERLGIDTVSYAMMLANHNSGRFLTSLKEPAP